MHSIDELFNQAVQFHQNGQTQQAESLYRKVLSQNAYHLAAHTNLGVCLIQQGRTEEAIASYQTALHNSISAMPIDESVDSQKPWGVINRS
jgi:Flp pilus assembly protein TadD